MRNPTVDEMARLEAALATLAVAASVPPLTQWVQVRDTIHPAVSRGAPLPFGRLSAAMGAQPVGGVGSENGAWFGAPTSSNPPLPKQVRIPLPAPSTPGSRAAED